MGCLWVSCKLNADGSTSSVPSPSGVRIRIWQLQTACSVALSFNFFNFSRTFSSYRVLSQRFPSLTVRIHSPHTPRPLPEHSLPSTATSTTHPLPHTPPPQAGGPLLYSSFIPSRIQSTHPPNAYSVLTSFVWSGARWLLPFPTKRLLLLESSISRSWLLFFFFVLPCSSLFVVVRCTLSPSASISSHRVALTVRITIFTSSSTFASHHLIISSLRLDGISFSSSSSTRISALTIHLLALYTCTFTRPREQPRILTLDLDNPGLDRIAPVAGKPGLERDILHPRTG